MVRSRVRQRGVNLDVWPGFVDALATLLIVMVFALMVFIVSQVYLSDALNNSQKGIESLASKLSRISSLLKVEKTRNNELSQSFKLTSQQLADLQALKAQMETDLSQKMSFAEQKATHAEATLSSIQKQVEELNQQLQKLNAALKVSEDTNSQQKVTIEDLDKKLAAAMIKKVEELEKYRSEFFGKLKELLANRSDIHIVGDRFVFQSEVLFPSASATIGKEGEKKLVQLATTLKEISAKMPKDLKWVLRVDGHTDNKPIHTDKFPSNWELSSARAISVIKFLTQHGITPEHLAAAGFGEFYPIAEKGDDKKNRRIEFKLDQR
jgi:chemotaxis protein MotB